MERNRDHDEERDRNEDAVASEGRLRTFARETLLPMFAVIAIIVPLRSAVADWNDVPSGSMRPTILEGDRIWVNKLAYGLRVPLTMAWVARWDEPARGDVVTMASPADGIRLVKRIVALPGDRISMRNNRLTINGHPLAYRSTKNAPDSSRPNGSQPMHVIETEELGDLSHAVTIVPALRGHHDSFDEFTVPEDHYFFLGDNRDRSRDSRFVGTVARGDIYGRVSHIALSVDPDRTYRPRFERWGMPLDSVVE